MKPEALGWAGLILAELLLNKVVEKQLISGDEVRDMLLDSIVHMLRDSEQCSDEESSILMRDTADVLRSVLQRQ